MGKLIQKKVQEFKKTAIMLNIIALIILGISGYFAYGSLNELLAYKEASKIGEEKSKFLKTSSAEIDPLLKTAEQNYQKMNKEKEDKLALILPQDENLTVLTKTLDHFFLENNLPDDALILNSITYENSTDIEEYRELSFTINVKSSRANFEKLIDYLKASGNFENPYRLMAIKSISIQFPEKSSEEQEGETVDPEKNLLNYIINAVAYYKK